MWVWKVEVFDNNDNLFVFYFESLEDLQGRRALDFLLDSQFNSIQFNSIQFNSIQFNSIELDEVRSSIALLEPS